MDKQAVAKAKRPVEKYGHVDCNMKKVKREGIQWLVEKNKVDAIVSQIGVLQRMKDVYVRMTSQEKYNKQIVSLMN